MCLSAAGIANANELVCRIVELLDSVRVVSLIRVRDRCRAVLFLRLNLGLGI